jgi:oxygen-independent coproporphyrinogen-3 oxidase
MFGLPDSSPADSLKDVATAISLKPTHISLYQLTLEPNTYFHKFPPQLPNDELIFDTQTHCQRRLADHGYQHYEVSAYSQPGLQCKHNINYWQFGDYLGIGAGAHGKITKTLPNQITRTFKPKSPEQYLKDTHKNGGVEMIAVGELPLEFIMNHLRLKQGFSIDTYLARTGLTISALEPGLSACIKEGLLIKQDNHYYCSEQGWNFMDNVLEKFMT